MEGTSTVVERMQEEPIYTSILSNSPAVSMGISRVDIGVNSRVGHAIVSPRNSVSFFRLACY